MPTNIRENVDAAIRRLNDVPRTRLIAGERMFDCQITTLIGEIDHACRQLRPFYGEGLARLYVAEGNLYFDADRTRALAAYDKALGHLKLFPFREENVTEQEALIEHVLWAKFVLTYVLGSRKEIADAAWSALEGVDYAADQFDPKENMTYWGQSGPVMVTGRWKRCLLRTYLTFIAPRTTYNRHHLATNGGR